ncbi:MAG: phage major tail tube protein [Armatimonadota bacterium]|nr:phage major tail tube protein [bacterium]
MKAEQAIISFNVYADSATTPLEGVSEIKLPSLQAITAELNLSGMAGKSNVALLGQFDTLTLGVTADIASKAAIASALQGSNGLTVRAAVQVLDTSTGARITQNRTYFMRGFCNQLDLGTIKKGESMGNSTEFELNYIKMLVDGEDVFELDKFNMVYRVNGTDMLADVRNAI